MQKQTMKRLSLGILLLCLWQCIMAKPAVENGVKYIYKSVPSTASQMLKLTHKYGNIHFNIWNKDSLKFEITVRAQAPKKKDVDDMLNMAEVKFEHAGSILNVTTKLENKLSFINQSILDISMTLNPGHKLEIEYTIYLPASVQLVVESKFGNIYIPDYKGVANIKLAHGDIMTGNMEQLKYLDLKYGKATVGDLGNSSITLQFASMVVKKARDLKVSSTSGDIRFEQVNSLWLTSRNDKLKIEKCGRFTGTSHFSNIELDELDGAFNLTSKYGTITIYKITAMFKDFTADGNYSNFNFNFEANAGYTLSVRLENSNNFVYPASRVKIDDKLVQEDVITYSGKTIAKPDGGIVRINLKSGKLNLG